MVARTVPANRATGHQTASALFAHHAFERKTRHLRVGSSAAGRPLLASRTDLYIPKNSTIHPVPVTVTVSFAEAHQRRVALGLQLLDAFRTFAISPQPVLHRLPGARPGLRRHRARRRRSQHRRPAPPGQRRQQCAASRSCQVLQATGQQRRGTLEARSAHRSARTCCAALHRRTKHLCSVPEDRFAAFGRVLGSALWRNSPALVKSL